MNGYVRKSVDLMSVDKMNDVLRTHNMYVEEVDGSFYLNVIDQNENSGHSFMIAWSFELSLDNTMFKWKCGNAHQGYSRWDDFEGFCGEIGYAKSMKDAQMACVDHRNNHCNFRNSESYFTITSEGGAKEERFIMRGDKKLKPRD